MVNTQLCKKESLHQNFIGQHWRIMNHINFETNGLSKVSDLYNDVFSLLSLVIGVWART